MSEPLEYWINGALTPQSMTHISPNDRSFLLGDGCFETLRWSKGHIEGAEFHLTSLRNACDVLGIGFHYSDEEMVDALVQVAEQLHGHELDGALRITVSRGAGGRGAATKEEETLVIVSADRLSQVQPLPAMSVVTSSIWRNESSPLSRIKSTSYADNLAARRDAVAKGEDEALMLNTQGRVSCLAMGNIAVFNRAENTLVTPSTDEGARPGYQRHLLLSRLRQKGCGVSECALERDALLAPGVEVFGLNSLWGVRPIKRLDDEQLLVSDTPF